MTKVQQQGEVRIERVSDLPGGVVPAQIERDASGNWIISHSEKGHHHVLPPDVDVMEKPLPKAFGRGMKILYAIVKEPTAMVQTAQVAHEPATMPPGIYEMRISIEQDPFTKQARAVAD